VETKTVGIFVGSLRRRSFSHSIAAYLASAFPAGYEARFIEMGGLALFNQDFDDEGVTPANWTAFREEVGAVDGVLFVTPEYNRSFPPVLKNALDIASRPYGQNKWDGKPGAIVSVAPGRIGAFGANHHLRQVLSFLNVYTLAQPEMYISNVATLLNAGGSLANEDTMRHLDAFVAAYTAWLDRFTITHS